MTSAEFQAQYGKGPKRAAMPAAPAAVTTDTAQPPKAPHNAQTPAQIEKEQTARRAVVGVGRLAWENPVFGLPAHYRKYRLLNAEQAAVLDAVFHHLTGTAPEGPPLARPVLLRALAGLGE